MPPLRTAFSPTPSGANGLLRGKSPQLQCRRQQSAPREVVASLGSGAQGRRAFLLAAGALLAGAHRPQAVAYSSPYDPARPDANAPLPDRLYEKEVSKVVKTASGLRYFDLAQGGGAEARAGSSVSVHYTSRLGGLNGIKLDSSFDRPGGGEPYRFVVGDASVVPGFSEAVAGMRAGGKRRALLTPAIGYASPDKGPPVKEFFARRRLLSVIETSRDSTIVFEYVALTFFARAGWRTHVSDAHCFYLFARVQYRASESKVIPLSLEIVRRFDGARELRAVVLVNDHQHRPERR